MGDVHLLKTEGRLLSAHEIAMLDAVRDVEAAVNDMIDGLRVLPGVDQRRAAIAATTFEEAFMWVQRAITRPERPTLQPGEFNGASQ